MKKIKEFIKQGWDDLWNNTFWGFLLSWYIRQIKRLPVLFKKLNWFGILTFLPIIITALTLVTLIGVTVITAFCTPLVILALIIWGLINLIILLTHKNGTERLL